MYPASTKWSSTPHTIPYPSSITSGIHRDGEPKALPIPPRHPQVPTLTHAFFRDPATRHIEPILDLFIELGVDILSPIQASANDLPR